MMFSKGTSTPATLWPIKPPPFTNSFSFIRAAERYISSGVPKGNRFCLSISPQKVDLAGEFFSHIFQPHAVDLGVDGIDPQFDKFRIQGEHMAAGMVENKFS